MSGHKYFDLIAVVCTVLMLVLTVLFINGSTLGIEVLSRSMGYENELFDQSRVHTLDITMDDWDSLIDNATSEEYYVADVTIDGEAFSNVGIRAKGNTSLSTVAALDSDRYSFKIEFDHYDESKSYHGLDKLSLNNLIQDSTMMKDYLTYSMMNAFGVDSSLCSYVYITVNGEDWGLYLAVEGVEEAFLERNYGSDYGNLYKPDSSGFGGGRGNGKNFSMSDFDPENADENSFHGMPENVGQDDFPDMPENAEQAGFPGMPEDVEKNDLPRMPANAEQDDFPDMPANMEKGGGPGGGMGSSDVKLQYTDDSLESYSNIWDNAKTDITEKDQTRLIASLQKLSAREDLDSVVNVEEVIRYFVVHNYVCNGDSYTGSMIHNYYLYEKDGQLSMIPWDYNLAFGTFQSVDADSTINTPIDAPIDNGSGEDRPMWNWIVSDETYTELYHQYYTEFLSTVDIEGIIDNAYALIRDYVKKDPTAFYSYEEFELGVETLRQFCALRSKSILTQLANGETTRNMGYADASAITLSDMGTMDHDSQAPGASHKSPAKIPKELTAPPESTESHEGLTVPPEPAERRSRYEDQTAYPST